MSDKLTNAEKNVLDVIANYTKNTRDTPLSVTGHGGFRPGAGRKPLPEPRKQRKLQATDAEWELIKKYADEVRGK